MYIRRTNQAIIEEHWRAEQERSEKEWLGNEQSTHETRGAFGPRKQLSRSQKMKNQKKSIASKQDKLAEWCYRRSWFQNYRLHQANPRGCTGRAQEHFISGNMATKCDLASCSIKHGWATRRYGLASLSFSTAAPAIRYLKIFDVLSHLFTAKFVLSSDEGNQGELQLLPETSYDVIALLIGSVKGGDRGKHCNIS